MDSRYPIHEVFASIQGEGLFVGQPQVFVRVDGCPLRCRWCDTPQTWGLPSDSKQGTDWSADPVRSWCTAQEVAERVRELDPLGRRSVSLTGGEPLMWPGLVEQLRKLLPGARLHLETAGAFPRTLERLLDQVDHVSADLKLPGDMQTPVPLQSALRDFEEAPRDAVQWRLARRAVLALLADRDACLKLVVAAGPEAQDYSELLDDVRELAADLPLYLQSVTPLRDVQAADSKTLDLLVEMAQSRGLSTRVLPQVHALLGLR